MFGLHPALSQEVDLAAALGAHLGQELRSKGAILDLGQDLLHLLAGLLGDQALAGALAGFGAGLYFLSNVSQWNPLNSTSLPAMGFNGISVALLASSNPIGTIFSALFISHISVGGSFLSTKYYPTEISDLISGIIIYLCAFSMLFRGKIHGLLFKNADKTNVNAEPAPAKTETKKEGK